MQLLHESLNWQSSLDKTSTKRCFSRKTNGIWRKYSAEEYVNTTNAIGYGLLNIGMIEAIKSL